MLIEFQFPLADARPLLPNSVRLTSPTWPFPKIGEEFIHDHGQVEGRMKGGVPDWSAEDTFCKVARGVRLVPPLPQQRIRLTNSVAILEGAFRRLFCDGRMLVRYEIALGTAIDDFHLSSQEDCLKFVDGCCAVSVKLPRAQASLGTAGRQLAGQYLAATTSRKKGKVFKIARWWVTSGTPLLLLSYGRGDVQRAENFTRMVIALENELVVRHCWIRHRGQTISTWFFEEQDNARQEFIRRIRVHLLRVHAERECLKSIFRLIVQGRVLVPNGKEEGNLLQDYLRQSLSFLSKTRSYGIWKSGILETFQEFEDIVSPGERKTLLNELARIRGNIRRQVEQFTAPRERARSAVSVNNGATVVFGTYYSADQVGAMGPNAHAHDMAFQQTWNEKASKFDLRELAKELFKLRSAMHKVATTAGQDAAVAEVAAAQTAAKKGNGPAALSHLHKAGQWARTIARKRRLDLATSALSVSNRLNSDTVSQA